MDEEEWLKKERLNKLMEENGNAANEVEINDSNFEEEVIKKSKETPVVVDFWASWCRPCVMLGPVLEKVAKEFNGKFVLAKANVDEAKSSSQKYGIMSIPNVKLFKDGKVVDEFVGAYPEDFVKKWIEKNL